MMVSASVKEEVKKKWEEEIGMIVPLKRIRSEKVVKVKVEKVI